MARSGRVDEPCNHEGLINITRPVRCTDGDINAKTAGLKASGTSTANVYDYETKYKHGKKAYDDAQAQVRTLKRKEM